MKLAVIGGSGFYQAGQVASTQEVRTPYGSATISRVLINDVEVLFLPRHGAGHVLPPHRINYRANIWALRDAGAEAVIATNTVGSLRVDLLPGQLVLPTSFLDFTSGRAATFYDGPADPGTSSSDARVVHTDVGAPYCATLRAILRTAAASYGLQPPDGCYVCTNGPRYESAAEVRAYAMLGGDVVGMTGVPEVVLAREAGLCYAALCLVTNLGAGLTGNRLAHSEVLQVSGEKGELVQGVLQSAIAQAAGLHCSSCE